MIYNLYMGVNSSRPLIFNKLWIEDPRVGDRDRTGDLQDHNLAL